MKKTRVVKSIAALYGTVAIGILGGGGYFTYSTISEQAAEAERQRRWEEEKKATYTQRQAQLQNIQEATAAFIPLAQEMLEAAPNAPYPESLMILIPTRTVTKGWFLTPKDALNASKSFVKNAADPDNDTYGIYNRCKVLNYLQDAYKVAVANYSPDKDAPLSHPLEQHKQNAATLTRCAP